MDIIKYLLIAIVLSGLLYFVPSNKMDAETILKFTLIAIIIIFLIENFIFLRKEGMSVLKGNNYVTPQPYNYDNVDEDYIQSGIRYDHGLPGYYIINNGHYTEGTIDNNKIIDLINASVWNDLYNQQNFNIQISPHTHVGKSRSYLNYEKPF